MNFTRQNIKNRTVLARCCYADMLIDMMEASASGDNELYNCMKKKAWLLRYAISQMCEYVSDNLFSLNAGSEPQAQAYLAKTTLTFPQSVGSTTTLTSIKFGGVDIATPGLALSSGALHFIYILPTIVNDINTYVRANQYTDGIYGVTASADLTIPSAPTLTISVTYDNSVFSPVTSSSTVYVDSPATNPTLVLDSNLALGLSNYSFTNDIARKFLNQMDEYCGCPCGDNSKVLNDTLPKYI